MCTPSSRPRSAMEPRCYLTRRLTEAPTVPAVAPNVNDMAPRVSISLTADLLATPHSGSSPLNLRHLLPPIDLARRYATLASREMPLLLGEGISDEFTMTLHLPR